jgi:hypothetical protein
LNIATLDLAVRCQGTRHAHTQHAHTQYDE